MSKDKKNKNDKKKILAGGAVVAGGATIGAINSLNNENQELYTQSVKQFSHGIDEDNTSLNSFENDNYTISSNDKTFGIKGDIKDTSTFTVEKEDISHDAVNVVERNNIETDAVEMSTRVFEKPTETSVLTSSNSSSQSIPTIQNTNSNNSSVETKVVDIPANPSVKIEGVDDSTLNQSIKDLGSGNASEEYDIDYGISAGTDRVEYIGNRGSVTYGNLSSPGSISNAATIVNANASNSNKWAIIPGGIYNNGKYQGVATCDIKNFSNTGSDNISSVIIGTHNSNTICNELAQNADENGISIMGFSHGGEVLINTASDYIKQGGVVNNLAVVDCRNFGSDASLKTVVDSGANVYFIGGVNRINDQTMVSQAEKVASMGGTGIFIEYTGNTAHGTGIRADKTGIGILPITDNLLGYLSGSGELEHPELYNFTVVVKDENGNLINETMSFEEFKSKYGDQILSSTDTSQSWVIILNDSIKSDPSFGGAINASTLDTGEHASYKALADSYQKYFNGTSLLLDSLSTQYNNINTIAENFDAIDNQASQLANYLLQDDTATEVYDRI